MKSEPFDPETALNQFKEKVGFVPNLLKEMKASPGVLHLYLKGHEYMAESVLSPEEVQMVMILVSKYNECTYCQAAHTYYSSKMGMDIEEVEALKSPKEPLTKRAKALNLATRLLMTKKGWLTEENLEELDNRGVDRRQVYEIIAIIGLKTIANYINHVAGTEIDEIFKTV